MKQLVILGVIVFALLALVTGGISARQVEAMARKGGQERPGAAWHMIPGVLVLLLAVVAYFVP